MEIQTSTSKDFYSTHTGRYFDYKDMETLKRFLNLHGKIQPRRRTGLTGAGQRALAQAIKRARFMALIPFVVK